MVLLTGRGVKVFKQLMERFVHEVERGIYPSEAGWVKADEAELDAFVEAELAERGEKGVRLRLHKTLEMEIAETWERDIQELVIICRDIARAMEVEDLVNHISDKVLESPDVRASLFLLGWWRMMKTSEFPVVVDEVLGGNFSPDEWYIETAKASLDLALVVAKKWWRINLEKTFETLENLSLPTPRQDPKSRRIDGIKEVLRWEKAVPKFTKDESEALTFLWCVDLLLTSKGISSPEAEFFLQRRTWELFEKGWSKKRGDIIEKVEEMVNTLPSPSLISWAEIIRFPW